MTTIYVFIIQYIWKMNGGAVSEYNKGINKYFCRLTGLYYTYG